jgi:hypothetical protein
MSGKRRTQRTPKGLVIPIPTHEEFFDALERCSRPHGEVYIDKTPSSFESSSAPAPAGQPADDTPGSATPTKGGPGDSSRGDA